MLLNYINNPHVKVGRPLATQRARIEFAEGGGSMYEADWNLKDESVGSRFCRVDIKALLDDITTRIHVQD